MTEESPNAVFDRIAKDISAKFIYQQVVRKMRAATVSYMLEIVVAETIIGLTKRGGGEIAVAKLAKNIAARVEEARGTMTMKGVTDR